jgi:hypothetical protein
VSAVADNRHPTAGRPRTDLDTYIVMDHAVCALADRRFMPVTHPVNQLHLLASLITQAECWTAEQVQAARHRGASWGEIGHALGTSAAAARQRWAPPRHSHRPGAPLAD